MINEKELREKWTKFILDNPHLDISKRIASDTAMFFLQEFHSHTQEVVGKHNARILNEFQLLGQDERVFLIPAMTKATKETLEGLALLKEDNNHEKEKLQKKLQRRS